MIKTAISVLGSFAITILLVARLLNAESVSETLVIGSLSLITATAFLYFLFGNKRENRHIDKSICLKNQIPTHYVALIILSILLEIFLFCFPQNDIFYEVLRWLLMLFFLGAIIILFVQIFQITKR